MKNVIILAIFIHTGVKNHFKPGCSNKISVHIEKKL